MMRFFGTVKFPRQPSVAPAKFRGLPQYDKDGCCGCGACANVCPAGAIEVSDDPKTRQRTITLRLDSCIFCGNCRDRCITKKGISFGGRYDMNVSDRSQAKVSVEKELLICEFCGSVVGAKDHVRFLAEKLGHLAYANPVMMLANQPENDFNDRPGPRSSFDRALLFRILCPRCRRAAMLEDVWAGETSSG